MIQKDHSLINVICNTIGFSETLALVGWFGGQQVQIPRSASITHPLAAIVGIELLEKLVEKLGGKYVMFPIMNNYAARDRKIAELVLTGKSDLEIAGRVSLTRRRVCQIRTRLSKSGLLDLPEKIAAKIASKNAREKLHEKLLAKTPLKKPPTKTPLEDPGGALDQIDKAMGYKTARETADHRLDMDVANWGKKPEKW